MVYKSQIQYEVLQKQGKFLQVYNEQAKKIKGNDIQKVKDLYLSGKSCNQIAKVFNCSKATILKVIKGLPKNDLRLYKHRRCYKQFGENNHAWKGGIKSIYDRVRDLNSYWTWHHSVLDRDNHKCVKCNCIENLQVHHIKTLRTLILDYCVLNNRQIIELTETDLNDNCFYDLNNGLTLCITCHKEWHKVYGRK